MVKRINKYDFRDEFMNSQYDNNFSIEGLYALYEYLTEIEECTDTELELDIVEIACNYSEYESFEEFKIEYSKFLYRNNIKNKKQFEEYVQNFYEYIKIDNEKFIIQNI